MGSLVETAMATADWLREHRGLRVGVLGVTVFRPFPAAEIAAALSGGKALAVIERMGNPLTTEIKAALCDAATAPERPLERIPIVYSAAAGLGSRDVRPGDFVAAVEEMAKTGRGGRGPGFPPPVAPPRAGGPDVPPPGA